MFDAATVTFLEGGCALIVGTVDPDGAPHAVRAWGLDVLDAATGRVRLLLDRREERARAHLAPGGKVAITCADVVTLASMQLKGRSAGEVPAASTDPGRVRRYTEAFYHDIEITDGTPRSVVERLTPDAVVPVEVEVTDVFDQTPGPAAGRLVAVEGTDRSDEAGR